MTLWKLAGQELPDSARPPPHLPGPRRPLGEHFMAGNSSVLGTGVYPHSSQRPIFLLRDICPAFPHFSFFIGIHGLGAEEQSFQKEDCVGGESTGIQSGGLSFSLDSAVGFWMLGTLENIDLNFKTFLFQPQKA